MPTKAAPKLDFKTIYDASTPDIRAFAKKECGLDFPEDTSRDYMILQVCDTLAWQKKDPSEDATHVEILIPSADGPNGELPYRGSFNGRSFTILRDQEAVIPIEYYNTIKDSQSLGFTVAPLNANNPNLPPNESMLSRRRKVTGYPMTVIRFINKGK